MQSERRAALQHIAGAHMPPEIAHTILWAASSTAPRHACRRPTTLKTLLSCRFKHLVVSDCGDVFDFASSLLHLADRPAGPGAAVLPQPRCACAHAADCKKLAGSGCQRHAGGREPARRAGLPRVARLIRVLPPPSTSSTCGWVAALQGLHWAACTHLQTRSAPIRVINQPCYLPHCCCWFC